VVGISQDDTEKIYRFIRQHVNGIALEMLAKEYQVSPENPAVLILLAELLADRKVKTAMEHDKLYCVAVEKTDSKEPSA